MNGNILHPEIKGIKCVLEQYQEAFQGARQAQTRSLSEIVKFASDIAEYALSHNLK